MKYLTQYCIKVAKQELNKNANLRSELKDLKHHFKVNKWDLDYMLVLEYAKCSEVVLNYHLTQNNFKVLMCNKSFNLIIRAKKPLSRTKNKKV